MEQRVAYAFVLHPGLWWVAVVEPGGHDVVVRDDDGALSRGLPHSLQGLDIVPLERANSDQVEVAGEDAGHDCICFSEVADDHLVDLWTAEEVVVEGNRLGVAAGDPVAHLVGARTDPIPGPEGAIREEFR